MPDTSNPAQVRGDIQRGLTGDKRSGYDPALAPMETDGEAAGTPLTQQQIEMARATQLTGVRDKSAPEYSNAMVDLPGLPAPPRFKAYLWTAAASLGIVIFITIVVHLLG